ncbi:hypothetical protein GALMADRAFT_144640 [Galerina marginata CBS 339.88]|uniref:Uncharacterized protein n=1 Tax=Galerina marginata (strain CBS 339.88) TaxID=685588 RepID=A0A067SJY4_GALM3|nr:hypothetical protein GALMADRAFT_144640 [Galerina marginata CBS 339.88]
MENTALCDMIDSQEVEESSDCISLDDLDLYPTTHGHRGMQRWIRRTGDAPTLSTPLDPQTASTGELKKRGTRIQTFVKLYPASIGDINNEEGLETKNVPAQSINTPPQSTQALISDTMSRPPHCNSLWSLSKPPVPRGAWTIQFEVDLPLAF